MRHSATLDLTLKPAGDNKWFYIRGCYYEICIFTRSVWLLVGEGTMVIARGQRADMRDVEPSTKLKPAEQFKFV